MYGVNFDRRMLDKILCVVHKSGVPQWLLLGLSGVPQWLQLGLSGVPQWLLLGLSPENRVDGTQRMSAVLPDNCG
jgi:hypothetical protein